MLTLFKNNHSTAATPNNVVHLLAESIPCHNQPEGLHCHVLLCSVAVKCCNQITR